MSRERKRWGNKVLGVLLFLLFAVVAAQVAYTYFIHSKALIHISGSRFEARIADTNKERLQGLSGTSQLPANEAMVFIFDSNRKWSIWMKDMNYSIDIVWLDESKKVVDFATNVSPDSYPEETFTPKEDARYVVEFQSGIVKEKGIKIGQEVVFSGMGREL